MWSHQIVLHNNPSNLEDSEDIEIPEFRSSTLRRGQLIELVAEKTGIPYKRICCWSENRIHPAFALNVLPNTEFAKKILERSDITPLDAGWARDIDITAPDTIEVYSLQNWLVGSDTGNIHIADIDTLLRQIPVDSLPDEQIIRAYFTMVVPWSYGAATGSEELLHPSKWLVSYLKGSSSSGGIPRTIRDRGRETEEIMEYIRAFPDVDEANDVCVVEHSHISLYPMASDGRLDAPKNHMGIPLTHIIGEEYVDGIDLRALFKRVPVSTDGIRSGKESFHVVYYDDVLTPTSSAVRIATIGNDNTSMRSSVVSDDILKDMVSGFLRRNQPEVGDIHYDIRKNSLKQDAFLRLAFSFDGTAHNKIYSGFLHEAIVYSDGRASIYLFGKHSPKDIAFIIEHLSTIILPGGVTYYPVQNIVASHHTFRDIPRSGDIYRQLSKSFPEKGILREFEVDGIRKYHYSLVNLPSDIDESGDLRVGLDLRKMITAMLLANTGVYDIIRELFSQGHTPGNIFSAIDALPEGRTEAELVRRDQKTIRELIDALNAFFSDLNVEYETRELGKTRGETDTIEYAEVFIQRRGDTLVMHSLNVPNLEILSNIRVVLTHLVDGIRTTEIDALQRQIADLEAKAEAGAKRKAEAEEEARRKAEAEEEARRKAEAEAEARRKAEAEEEARRKAEAEEEASLGDEDASPGDEDASPGDGAISGDGGAILEEDASPRDEEASLGDERSDGAILEEDARSGDGGASTGDGDSLGGSDGARSLDGENERTDGASLGDGDSLGGSDGDSFDRDSVQSEEPIGGEDDDDDDALGWGRQIGRGDEYDDILFDGSYRLKRLKGENLYKTKGKRRTIDKYKTIAGSFKDYSRGCQKNRQPIIITEEEYRKFIKDRPGVFGHDNIPNGNKPISDDPEEAMKQQSRFAIKYNGFVFVCPKYWSMKDDGSPLYPAEADAMEDKIYVPGGKADINKGRFILRTHDPTNKYNTKEHERSHTHIYYPGINAKNKPCCFLVGKTTKDFNGSYTKNVTNRLEKAGDEWELINADASEDADDDASTVRTTVGTVAQTSVNLLDNTVGAVRREDRWNPTNVSMLLPSDDLIQLLGLAENQCDNFTRKGFKSASACMFRQAHPVAMNKNNSLYRALLAAYRFTVLSCISNKEYITRHNLLLTTPGKPDDDISTFAKGLSSWITPNQFRTLQGGSVFRSFASPPAEVGSIDLGGWIETYKDDLKGLYDVFKMEVDRGEPSKLLQTWATAHTRFIEYLLDESEPKLLKHVWELCTIYPWKALNAHMRKLKAFSAGEDTVFADGVNIIVIRTSEPPMVLCPSEGGINRYFKKTRSGDERPTVIILENDEMTYQPLILASRNTTRKGKKITLHGAVLPDQSVYTSLADDTRRFLTSIWSSVARFTEHSRYVCKSETIEPVSYIPNIHDVYNGIVKSIGKQPTGLVLDSIGRTTSLVYEYDGRTFVFPVNPNMSLIPPGKRVYIGHTQVNSSLQEYNETYDWLESIRRGLPPSPAASGAGGGVIAEDKHQKMRKSLARLKPIVTPERDDTGRHIGFSIQGIRLDTGAIVPVNPGDSFYSPSILRERFGINIQTAVINTWDSDTNDLLTMNTGQLPIKLDAVSEAIVASARNILSMEDSDPEFKEIIQGLRKNHIDGELVPRAKRIQLMEDFIRRADSDGELIVIPSVTMTERADIRNIIIRYLSLLSMQKIILQQTARKEEALVGSIAPDFPTMRGATEIQLTFDKLSSLRATDLLILDSKRTRLNDTFGIGGVPDELYLPVSVRSQPRPLPNVWKNIFKYTSNANSYILQRDGIKAIQMLPPSADPVHSWESVAVVFRTPLEEPSLNAVTVRTRLHDEWKDLLHTFKATRAGSENWRKISNVIRRENRGFDEGALLNPSNFLSELQHGHVYPGLTDLIILMQQRRDVSVTHSVALLHHTRHGETIRDLTRPMTVYSADKSRWKNRGSTISFLLRQPDGDKVYYSALVGVKQDSRLPYEGTFYTHSQQLTSTVLGKISAASDSDTTWKNVYVDNWVNIYLMNMRS